MLGWKVDAPDPEPDLLADQLSLFEAQADPEPEPDDGLSWDEWIRGLPPIR